MNLTKPKKYFLFGLPVLLLLSTALVFVFLSQWLGSELGYVTGFVFYWLAWCLMVPVVYLGKDGLLSLFREQTPLLRKENWLTIALLFAVTVGALIIYPPSRLAEAPALLIVIAIPVAIVNGICEETLWRGLYVRAFPDRLIPGLLYPTIGFAVWHISPQLVFPDESGLFVLVGSTFFLGLCYAWIAYRTGSVIWNALSHSVNGIFALGGFIAPSLFRLISS